MPRRMCVGVPTTVEVRAPRSGLEAWSGSNDPRTHQSMIITKAMAMRLKAPGGGFTIEIASPETQWSDGALGPLGDDIVSWRWIVTPQDRGRHTLLLAASTRIVGRDGLAAERPLPEQSVEIRVAANMGRAGRRLGTWLVIAAGGGLAGYFADDLITMGGKVLAMVV